MIPSIGNPQDISGLGLMPSERPVAPAEPAGRVTSAEQSHPGQFRQSGNNTPGMRQYPEPPQSSLEKALASVNDSLRAWSTGMRFEMDEDAQRLVVSIVDSSTGDVLRTIPSDAVLRVAKMIVQLQGTGVDTQA